MSIFDTVNKQAATKETLGNPFLKQNEAPQTQKPTLYEQQVVPQAQAADPGLGIFVRMGNAVPSIGRNPYTEPGVYPVLYIDLVKMVHAQTGMDHFTVEFYVLESRVTAHPPGMKVTWQEGFKYDSGPANARLFISLAMNAPIEEVTSNVCALACSDANPLHGRLISLAAHRKEGKKYTYHNWTSIPEEYQARAEEFKATICP